MEKSNIIMKTNIILKNIFNEGELKSNSVVANCETTALDGENYNIDYYNLDVIFSVIYHVKSPRGTQFRIWAMNILKEYLKKRFVLDDHSLKYLRGFIPLIIRGVKV